MKKILLGFSNNIYNNRHKIKIWAESFKKHSNGEIILIAANVSELDLQILDELLIKYHVVQEMDTWQLNHKRLKHTVDLLENLNADVFLITDVFDVAFQADPFLKFDIDNYDIFIGAEGVLVSQEPWNADVIKKVFPEYLEICMNTEILCSGVIGGTKKALIDLYQKMFFMCENSLDGHNIKDQAALIILFATDQIPRAKIFNLDDGWVIHCAVAGPTEFFESWGLKNSISKHYGIPTLINNKICTATGFAYDIVHQFNRIPEWCNLIKDEYS
jgi:hypothetical protein